jgi:hypothetical protein
MIVIWNGVMAREREGWRYEEVASKVLMSPLPSIVGTSRVPASPPDDVPLSVAHSLWSLNPPRNRSDGRAPDVTINAGRRGLAGSLGLMMGV